jgi:mRNA interferase YafQ
VKYELSITRSFKIDYKKLSSDETSETDAVIKTLLAGKILEERFKDHDLHGNYKGYRECHVRPDLLLVYKKEKEEPGKPKKILILTCYRISSHANIFDIKKSKKK